MSNHFPRNHREVRFSSCRLESSANLKFLILEWDLIGIFFFFYFSFILLFFFTYLFLQNVN
jgi:hypothetical protein